VGDKLDQPEGKMLKVSFPYNLFVTMFNSGRVGKFKVTFSYLDQDVLDTRAQLIEKFSVTDVYKERAADLTYVYILGGLIGAIILICGCYVCHRLRTVSEKHQADLIKRDQGIVEEWGTRRTPKIVDDNEVSATFKSNKRGSYNKVTHDPNMATIDPNS